MIQEWRHGQWTQEIEAWKELTKRNMHRLKNGVQPKRLIMSRFVYLICLMSPLICFILPIIIRMKDEVCEWHK